MIVLFKGLGILFCDNEFYSSLFDKQVVYWCNFSEQQICDEVVVLVQVKCQWLIVLIVGWQVVLLLIFGLIVNYLWCDDFYIIFICVVIVFGFWVLILFVIWFMVNMFDQQVGFECWMKVFNSCVCISFKVDSVEYVVEVLDLVEYYLEVLDYKQVVSVRCELCYEDICIMIEIGWMKQYFELVGCFNYVGEIEYYYDLIL